MKLLLDNHLPPSLAELLTSLGFLTEHVREHRLEKAADAVILDFARENELVIVTSDSDFPEMLALSGASSPSVAYLIDMPTRPEPLSIHLANVLPRFEEDLHSGAVLAISPTRVRVRKLPIRG